MSSHEHHDHHDHQRQALDQVPSRHGTDPVCGMQIDPDTALSAEHDGHAYYLSLIHI